jgi:hypothetical protein
MRSPLISKYGQTRCVQSRTVSARSDRRSAPHGPEGALRFRSLHRGTGFQPVLDARKNRDPSLRAHHARVENPCHDNPFFPNTIRTFGPTGPARPGSESPVRREAFSDPLSPLGINASYAPPGLSVCRVVSPRLTPKVSTQVPQRRGPILSCMSLDFTAPTPGTPTGIIN